MKKLLYILMAIAISLNAYAQAPQSFNYQGVARNSTGTPLTNQPISVRASILIGSSSGSVEYAETQSTTTNQYGLFTIAIGNGTPVYGTFSGINWSDSTKYLKIEFDPTGGTNYILSGTTQILSVPYALYAGNSGLQGMQVYSTAGIYTFTVPKGVTKIIVEVWGGGGAGATASITGYGFGGGGGGYGKDIFSVTAGANYTVTVGDSGGTSSLGTLISATGGGDGTNLIGGAGGTSTASLNITGGTGSGIIGNGADGSPNGGTGGSSGQGGAGGCEGCVSVIVSGIYIGYAGGTGIAPGGGGGGGVKPTSGIPAAGPGGAGAPGRVVVYW